MKYSNALLIFLAVALIIHSGAQEAWKCNPDETHRCPSENQTCCPSIHAESKYVCFNSPNGVCCPDDQNFCPHGFKCNMIDLKCDPVPSVLTFLNNPTDIPAIVDSIHAMDNNLNLKTPPNAGDILQFALGFVEGFDLLSNLPKEHDCLNKIVDPSIPQDVLQIYELLKSLNLHSDFIAMIKSISWYGIDIYTKLSDAISPCKDWALELKETGTKILSVFTTDKYLEKLGLHILLYIGEYRDKATKGYNSLIAGDYKTSGQAFGDLVKFALFWDYKN